MGRTKVILLAGGSGTRMGGPVPKQFLCVGGKPVIYYTLRALEDSPSVDAVLPVCIPGWEEKLREALADWHIRKVERVLTGGTTRYLSTRIGMEAACVGADEKDVLIVHDAVRTMVPEYTFADVARVCRQEENAMAVIEVVDTLYARDGEKTASIVDRSKVVRGQTPEAVTVRRAREMYALADARGVQDDSISALQVKLGFLVHFARGAAENIKLTRREDLRIFEAMRSSKEGKTVEGVESAWDW